MAIFYDLILPLYTFYLTTIFHHYLHYHCFYIISFIRFSAYITHFYRVYSTKFSGFFISFFISLYSLNTLVTEINSSWPIYESIKALEIRTSSVFKIYLFLIPAVIAQIFIPFAEFRIPKGTQTNEENAEIQTNQQLLST